MFQFRRRGARLTGAATLAVLAALAIGVGVANRFAGPLPPRRLVMSTGREDGAYYEFGLQYRQVLAAHGFTLDIVPGAGSVETLTRLVAGTADVGFVQGGTTRAVDTTGLTALGGVFDEPVWVFHRRSLRVTDLADLEGRRVAVGEPASGTRLLALQLLNDTGVTAANTTLRELSGREVEGALRDGTVDAAFVVASARAPLVYRLLAIPELAIMSERRHLAYRSRHPFLTSLPIGEGMIDMTRNIPSEDKVLLAARASLVVRSGIHPDLVRLLLLAADRVHHATSVGEQAGRFPSESFVELPLNEQAARYLRSGPSWLERTFPFWLAGLLDRLVLIVLPVITLLFPLFGWIMPMLERSRRVRIARWYGVLRAAEHRSATADAAELDAEIARLREVRRRVAELRDTPVLHLGELYHLRVHIDRVLERLERQRKSRDARRAAAGRG
jgi:uncharacterized protein